MKKILRILVLSLFLTNTSIADMYFTGFVKSNDGLHGIGRYCIHNSVFVTNLKLDSSGSYVPIGSPVQVYEMDQGRVEPVFCMK